MTREPALFDAERQILEALGEGLGRRYLELIRFPLPLRLDPCRAELERHLDELLRGLPEGTDATPLVKEVGRLRGALGQLGGVEDPGARDLLAALRFFLASGSEGPLDALAADLARVLDTALGGP